ncbi:MAG: HAD family hydrolase [Clostridia bacterium]|nr:HAD family hydrolase [Clostridia bacterium]
MNFFDKIFSAAIFDMDGTMFDTERLRIEMLKKASGELYIEEISDSLLYECLGLSAVTAEKLVKERYGDDYPYREIRARADQLEREYVRQNGVPVKNGLYNLLERLKKNNVFLALATSSRREIAEEYLINAKVYRYFNILVCGDDVKKGKPDPEIFNRAAAELACPTEECLIFEDSQNGLIAASASGGIPIFIKDIKDPEPKIKSLAYRAYDKMTDFLRDFIAFTPKLPMPLINEYFPQTEDYFAVGIHGFGAIGGGYLAQIFSHWDGYTRPNQIIGATRNPLILNLVNALGKYRIRYESQAYFQTISNVHLINMEDEADMLSMYEKSHIIGLALPETAIRFQAKTIAKGLKERYENGGYDLTILIVMNKVNAARFVKNHVKTALITLVSPQDAEDILSRTTFIETVVNRMVLPVSEEFLVSKFINDLSQLHHNVLGIFDHIDNIVKFFEPYSAKPSGSSKKRQPSESERKEPAQMSVSGNLSALASLSEAVSEFTVTLFIAEPDMPLYAAQGSDIVKQLRQIVVAKDIRGMQEIKNKLSNGTHAIIAWYAKMLNYKTIGQGMGDSRVEALAKSIMKNEIKPALLMERPEYSIYINTFISDFINRCRYSFKDKCSRVGRGVLRKLQKDERIIGAIQMARKHGIDTAGLEFGAACAILSCVLEEKPSDNEAAKVKALYKEHHSVADVLAYDGEYNKGKYKGLDREQDKDLIMRIQAQFDSLLEMTDKAKPRS